MFMLWCRRGRGLTPLWNWRSAWLSRHPVNRGLGHHSMNISIPSRFRCSRNQPSAKCGAGHGFHPISATSPLWNWRSAWLSRHPVNRGLGRHRVLHLLLHRRLNTCRIVNPCPSSLANRSLCHTCKCTTIPLSTPRGLRTYVGSVADACAGLAAAQCADLAALAKIDSVGTPVLTCRIVNPCPSSLANRSLCHTCKCTTIPLSTLLDLRLPNVLIWLRLRRLILLEHVEVLLLRQGLALLTGRFSLAA
jgi:hypothetical protein